MDSAVRSRVALCLRNTAVHSNPVYPSDVATLKALTEATAEVFSTLGYRSQSAFDGQEAVDAVHRACPDIVPLDIHMPGLDGRDAAREIRTKYPGHPPILIALSAVVHFHSDDEIWPMWASKRFPRSTVKAFSADSTARTSPP